MSRLLGMLLVLATVATPGVAGACEMADQYKLFPVGTVDGDIIALELDQLRTSDTPSKVYWIVRGALVRIDDKGGMKRLARYEELGDVKVADYLTRVQQLLDKALSDARELDDFVEVRQLRVQRCEFLDDCFEWSVAQSDSGATLSRKRGKRRVPVSTPLPSLLLEHANVFPEFRDFHLVSVRHYRAGKLRFAVVDLGDGSFLNPCEQAAGLCVDDRKPTAAPSARGAEDTLYLEPPAHHGVNFDTVVRL